MKNLNRVASILFSLGLICILVGASYAFFLYSRTGLYNQVISGGRMNVIYDETAGNNITLDNAYPLTDREALTKAMEFEFTITGYNESDKNVYYAIEIEQGNDVTGKTRFLDSDMKLSLYENDILVLKNEVYDNLNKQDIYYGHITYGTSESSPVVNTYRLRMWINDTVFITNTPDLIDTTGKHVYTTSEFSNSYGSYRVNIKADLTYDEIGYLTYDANGGSYTPTKTSLTTNKITAQKPVLANKGFLGWSSDPYATVPEYKAGDSYSGVGQVLYAVYGDTRNVMTKFPTTITDQKAYITEVYFINDTKENIDTRYGDSSIRADLTVNNQGSVKEWLEEDYLDESNTQYYKLYVGSEGTTYLNTGNFLFDNWSKVTTIDFTNVDTSSVTNMDGTFYGCSSLTSLDVSSFNTSNVTNMANMFYGCRSLIGLDLSSFITSSVTSMRSMFCYCSSLISLDVSNFSTNNVTTMEYMFNGCSSLTSLDVSNFDTSNVTNMAYMFNGCGGLTSLEVSNFDTSKVTTIETMFSSCSSLTSLDLSSFITSSVTAMSYMFNGCSSLTSLDVSNFDTSNVIYMNYMFFGCGGLTSLDVSNFITNNVTDMSNMFTGCNNLTNLDVSSFNTSSVEYMNSMFSSCSSLIRLDLSNFITNNVTNMSYMFNGCSSLTSLDLSSFDTSKVTGMSGMFSGCSSLTRLDLSSFITSNVTNMSSMFQNCSSLASLDLSKFVTSKVTNISSMFNYCRNITSLDISNFTFDETVLTSYNYMFRFISATAIIKVKSATEQAWILALSSTSSLSNRPAAWTESNVIIKA